MDQLNAWANTLSDIVWGPVMLGLVLGTALFLMLGLRFMPIWRIGHGFSLLWKGRDSRQSGNISPFNALMTSMSATIGAGNIIGVGVAIALGGPGAIFWIWCAALFGIVIQYAETVLAVKYRESDVKGNYLGGPMYYIKNGLGDFWQWMGIVFALLGVILSLLIGNLLPVNAISDVVQNHFSGNPWVINGITGGVLLVLVFLSLVGGLKRIAKVAGFIVPLMLLAYAGGGLAVIFANVTQVPDALLLIFKEAFTPTAVGGGFAGAAILLAIQTGLVRGVLSSDTGLGTSSMVHAAAKTNMPVRQGTIAMLGTLIDALVISTITGLVIVMSGLWNTGETGAALSLAAFSQGLPGVGEWVVTLGLVIFAFTTILGWSVYGERCMQYLFGIKSAVPFRTLWILLVPLGAFVSLEMVWVIAGLLKALMTLPNLIALILLAPVVFKLTKDYVARH